MLLKKHSSEVFVLVESLYKSGKLFYLGNAVLKYRIEFFRTENEEINSFYESVAQSCENFCREKMFDTVKDVGKRYVYEAKFVVNSIENGILNVLTSVCLKCEGEILFKMNDEKHWEIENGIIVKIKEKKK